MLSKLKKKYWKSQVFIKRLKRIRKLFHKFEILKGQLTSISAQKTLSFDRIKVSLTCPNFDSEKNFSSTKNYL